MKRLPDTELEVMKALWALGGRAAARSELETALDGKGWAANTVNTYLTRLAEKGFVSCAKQGRSNYYTPLISQADYLAFESRATLDRLFGSSLKGFVAALSGSGRLKGSELEELQDYLEELKARGEG